MKIFTCFMLSAIFLLISFNLAANSPIPVNSSIESVKVYRTGAVIDRVATVNLSAGVSEIHFTALSPFLDPNSLMVTTAAGVTILSVNASREFLTEIPRSAEFQNLEKQIEDLNKTILYERAKIEVLAEEESLLLSNKSIGGQHTGITANQLETVSAYFRKRLGEIKTERIDLQHNLSEQTKLLTRLRNQLAELQRRFRPDNSYTVVIRAIKTVPGSTPFKLSYLTSNSRWVSTFDFRVEDISSPLTIDYKGDVVNGSGEDWNNVNLTLSTGDPARNNVIPVLAPWRIGYYTQPPIAGRHQSMELEEIATMKNIRSARDDSGFAPPPGIAQSGESLTTTEFKINDPFTIPADGKTYTLILESNTKEADYFYTIVPKRNSSAYLTATIKNYETLNLTAGEAGIYLAGAYIGKTYINPFTAEDSLNISLGVDIGIAVQREKLQDKSTRGFLSNKREETHAWSIKVRNNKSSEATIKVYDQIPLPRLDEIEVRSEVENQGKLDDETGIISWNLQLKPGEQKELRFSYTVRYPRNRVIGW